ncbi:MAG: GNAT family N-acetyltransferase [Rhodomicrobiaceae bacterium]
MRELTPDFLCAPVETRRLVLRPPVIADLPAICRLVNDPDIAVNTGAIRYPYAPIMGRKWLEAAGRMRGGAFHVPYLLTLRSNTRLFAGVAGIAVRQGRPPTIGYWLARSYRGKGLAAEAARALITVIFAKSNAVAVVASCRTSNDPSRRVLEAAGMRRVGRGRLKSVQLGRYVPVLVYRIDRKSWEKARALTPLGTTDAKAAKIAL